MTSLDNHHHAHDGCCVHNSCEREFLVIEDYYGMDDFAEEGGFQCEDDDIMVEVLGSDVYVDGVCGDGNTGDRCFAAGVASGGELDVKLWPHGAVDDFGEGLESMWQGLDGRTESVSVDSSDRVSEEGITAKNENLFSVFDLVWIKLKSHQWWPGQIVDPSEDLSEKAVGFCSKSDSFLLAYFGDQTFAWHEASSLKPFLNFFSKAVMQPNSEVFRNAVDCALVEFSRRVQLGLACPCIPKKILDEMRYPAIVNDKTRKYLRTRDTVDYSASASSFKPEKLLKFINRLARSPSDEVDPLDLAVTKTQILCFDRHNGCDRLPEVQYGRAVSEGEGDGVYLKDEVMSSGKEGFIDLKSPRKFRHDWNDMANRTIKERSLAELMGDPGEFLEEAPSSRKKHRVHDPSISPCNESVEKDISIANGISTSSLGMKPSLNIGESAQRFSSHLPGSLESNGERSENGECALLNGFEIFISDSGDVQFPEYSLSDDLLEQLQFVADNPLEGHEKSIVLNSGPSEIYQFEDTNDSYWTDRVIATNTHDQQYYEYNTHDQQYYEYEGEAMIEDSRKLGTLDRQPSTAKESSVEGDCLLVDDNSPAELVLIFPKTGSFPVASTLNKTLKMFGPLKESETQVDRKSNRARVVFRKFGDAKVAFSSAQKYSIFGPLAVKYQLNHPISDP